MPHYDAQDDDFDTNSHFLAASTSKPRNGHHHSLAHELAVALMPEPSAGSMLLAEEFGIEYDDAPPSSFADETHAVSASDASFNDLPAKAEDPSQLEVLAQDLHSTDMFLGHLRTLDVDHGSFAAQQPVLEKLASEVIRRINETVRSREAQVRELLECEREFRKIAGEMGGSDVLGQLDGLEDIEDFSEPPQVVEPTKTEHRHHLDTLKEETTPTRSLTLHHQLQNSDWELDPDRHRLGDEVDGSEPATSPTKDSFLPAPSIVGPPTPASAIPQLAHLRSCTTSLVSSLSTISEHAQVNRAATTEAGRKIRALKNKIGGWRTDWDSAERSRIKIERWEAGIGDGEDLELPASLLRPTSKRTDGRRVVEEHLHAFELALADAALKTQTIMAR